MNSKKCMSLAVMAIVLTLTSGIASADVGHIDKLLWSKTVVIDPGHNSNERAKADPVKGGSGEYTINHNVAKKLEKLLEDDGALVYITDRDGGVKNPTISNRAKYAIRQDPDLFISIHTNAADPTSRGVEVWKWSENDQSWFKEKELATLIYKNVKKETQEPIERYRGKPKERENPWPKGVPILKAKYPCPAVLVELDFTTYSKPVTFNGNEYKNMRELMMSSEYQNSAALALRNSIVKYFTQIK